MDYLLMSEIALLAVSMSGPYDCLYFYFMKFMSFLPDWAQYKNNYKARRGKKQWYEKDDGMWQ